MDGAEGSSAVGLSSFPESATRWPNGESNLAVKRDVQQQNADTREEISRAALIGRGEERPPGVGKSFGALAIEVLGEIHDQAR